MSGTKSYARVRSDWALLNGGGRGPRSIRFHRRGSYFSRLYMPKRAAGSSNGSFMRAPRRADS